MDVIPTVAQETASRYHKKAGDRPMSSAVTADLTALLTRLWLLKERDGLDSAGDVAASVATIEQRVEEMVDFLLHRCQAPALSTLSLQVRSENLRRTHVEQTRQSLVKREAIAVQLEDAVLGMEPGLVTVEQVWAALAVSLIHHYSSAGGASLSGTASATNTAAASTAAAAAASAPSSDPAYGEAVAAVSAALPRAQVAGFLRQDRVERAGQLRQVRRIAWGLRLYQKETGRSAGTDVASLSATVDAPLAALEGRAAEALAALESRVRLTRALLTSPTCTLPQRTLGPLREEYHHLLLMLHVLRSVQCGLRQLRDCVSASVMTAYNTTLEALHELLSPARKKEHAAAAGGAAAAPTATAPAAGGGGSGEAAPRRVVFPKFMELADAYELGVKCAEEFSQYTVLLQIVAESAEGYESTLPQSAAEDALAREVAARAAAASTTAANTTASALAALAAEMNALLTSQATRQRLPAEVHVRYCAELPLHTVDPVVALLYPESSCAMRGYCPVRFLDGRPAAGLLLPGQVTREAPASAQPLSPSASSALQGEAGLGCVEVSGGTGTAALYRPLRFLFSDAAAMRAFGADPWRYVEGCLRRFHPSEPSSSLVMGLAEELPRELYLDGARRVERLSSIVANAQTAAGKADCGTQTGQVDSFIDHHYFWNEWDLRRHALKLANVMQLRTHSSQTAASHYRREATTQVHPLKDSETQTLMDAATQPPRVVQYLKGLRGTEVSAVEQVQHVVEF